MDAITEELRRSKQHREDLLVEQAFSGLTAVFALLDKLGRCHRIRKLHALWEQRVRLLLRERFWLCALVIGFVQPPEKVAVHLREADVLDPMVQGNLCVLLAYLVEEYPTCFAGNDLTIVRHCLRQALSLSIDAFLKGVTDQAEKLAVAVGQMAHMVKRVRTPGSRVLMLELPIGNSIPI